ncbi:MAG: zinc transporter ZupT [Candidatus Altiarchaeota archaeon]|nr:zinc transporter ZupT [Candidatus Altiarchaeota archaeon]
MEASTLLFAFSLTLLAGLSTGIGGLLAFFTKKTNTKFLSLALGFSAGVMIYVSFVDIFPLANKALVEGLGLIPGSWATVAAFFAGMILIAVIDKIIPEFENVHEVRRVEEMEDEKEAAKFRKLHRLGLFTAISIAIHNFPEGLATFVSAIIAPKHGIAIAFAVAIHNIPEGIAVAIPIYYATRSRKKALFYSFVAGLAEPLGALVGFMFLSSILNGVAIGALFAAVAGIMVFISLDELLPTAMEYGESHLVIYGLMAGMMTMAVSLLLFL